MKNIVKMGLWIIVLMFCVDVLGFVAWRTSGQTPPDRGHAGIITESIIKLVK